MVEPDKTISRITALVNRGISRNILESLKEAGVSDICLTAGRSPVIGERRGLSSLFRGSDLQEDPVDIYSFVVAREMEEPLMDWIIDRGELNLPGRGSVYSEEIGIPIAHAVFQENRPAPIQAEKPDVRPSRLTGISCIVQRGQGNPVAKVPLYTGSCVPSIHYGIGTGVRDKMGLLRITIPAEKELITMASTAHDAEVVMEMMIEVGKLAQPGKGFIYLFPVKRGLMNLQVIRGEKRQAASVEQIVAAIDHLKGGTEWRRWSGKTKKKEDRIRYLSGLVDLTLITDEGTGSALVKAAMSVGAPGATIHKVRHIRPQDSPLSQVSPAREACSMIVSEDQVERTIQALKEAGALGDRCHGQVLTRRVTKAFTYLGSSLQ